ncbi:MAG: TraB/GumN family protein [Acidobacteria bacterium]|nr:TraB/GumN family protein [Acidobacteriota bacterium]
MNWRALLLAASAAAPAVPAATAQQNDESRPTPVDLIKEEIHVLGELPGPPLWKVTKGDHVLWILGTPKLVPNDLLWQSDSVEHALAHSSEYLPSTSLGVTLLNPVKAWRLIKRIRRIPDRGTLEDALPEDLYQLFSETKLRYAPNQDNLERLRPSVAAEALFDSAVQSAGLESGRAIRRAIEKAARKHNVKKVPTRLTERYKDSPLFDSMQEVSPGVEQTCLQARLQELDARLEAHTRLASAWAVGDLATLRAHPGDSATGTCDSYALAFDPEELSRMASRSRALWLENVDRALTDNDSTFAVLPLDALLRPDGPLSWLRQRGYEVLEPDEAPPDV